MEFHQLAPVRDVWAQRQPCAPQAAAQRFAKRVVRGPSRPLAAALQPV